MAYERFRFGGLCLGGLLLGFNVNAAEVTIPGPSGSEMFGFVLLLPNGNFVVNDPSYDAPGPVVDVGAVHLYRADGVLISSLYGSSPSDRIGSEGIKVLNNGNFIVLSPGWDNGAVVNAGAVTWGSATHGVDGVVGASNSLVGSAANEAVGGAIAGEFSNQSVVALANGNYVVRTPNWDHGAIVDAGAVTWGDGNIGAVGLIDSGRALVGATTNDHIGSRGVAALTNGNYVVSSPGWDKSGVANVGAVTWGNGSTGTAGKVGIDNSLVGSSQDDAVGDYPYGGAIALSNGNYVVVSPDWHGNGIAGAGAVTWGSGTVGIVGTVSAANSIVGTHIDDQLGSVTPLTNGNFVVASTVWDNGPLQDVGAARWVNGSTGGVGGITAGNALIGAVAGDLVGTSVTALSNGHYVVSSQNWKLDQIPSFGAVTWGDGVSGSTGVVTAANSLIGAQGADRVGSCGIKPLVSGHYVVCSHQWHRPPNGEVGAVTWRDGNGIHPGVVSESNSLIGSSADDHVGFGAFAAIVALDNGKYVVPSRDWDNGSTVNAGAITLSNADGTTVGEVSSANSLVGTSTNDRIGDHGVAALSGGNYLVVSAQWDSATVVNAGAVTWGNGGTGISGPVTPGNSLVGSTTGDLGTGYYANTYDDGRSMIIAYSWDNGSIVNAGAVTLLAAENPATGEINAANSFLGTLASGGPWMRGDYDVRRRQIIVGQPLSQLITLSRPGIDTSTTVVGVAPDPSVVDSAVVVSVSVTSTVQPAQGAVRVVTDRDEECLSSLPTPVAGGLNFECELTFHVAGPRTVRAEFFGTQTHGYSASPEVAHSVIPDPQAIFANGYE